MRSRSFFQRVLLFLSIGAVIFSATYVSAAEDEYLQNTVKASDCRASGREAEEPSSTELAAGGSEIAEIEMQVLDLINDERERRGLPWLSWSDQLFQAARDHSKEMATMNNFSHDPDESTFCARLTAAGYEWSIASEVVATGQATAQEVFDTWMNSDDQREELLNASYCEVGIGHADNELSDQVHYWTLNLGKRQPITGCPQAEPEANSESAEPVRTQSTAASLRTAKVDHTVKADLSIKMGGIIDTAAIAAIKAAMRAKGLLPVNGVPVSIDQLKAVLDQQQNSPYDAWIREILQAVSDIIQKSRK